MKNYNHLFNQVCTFSALMSAAKKAALGKKKKRKVAEFLFDLEPEIIKLEQELKDKSYQPLPYRTFMVIDPKERKICAANFRDRVVHHAVCNVLEPIFERSFIFDSYACRKNKGTHLAVKRAQHFLRQYPYYLKLDIKKFFDSISHVVLKSLLQKKIQDTDLIWLLNLIIDHQVPWTKPGLGLPIGNLTSQHFANFYMDKVDHFIKDDLGVKGYLRYMDDSVLFANRKQELWNNFSRIEHFVNQKLKMQIKEEVTILAPVHQGLTFLGFRIFPSVIRIDKRGFRRFRRKVMSREMEFSQGLIDEENFIKSMTSLVGHLRQANTRNLCASFCKQLGASYIADAN